jgi:hypothetical protein
MDLKIDTLQCSVGVAGAQRRRLGVLRPVSVVWARRSDDSSSRAEFSGRLGQWAYAEVGYDRFAGRGLGSGSGSGDPHP